MDTYLQQAKDFLTATNTTMEIKFIGVDYNDDWNDQYPHNKYNVTIKTPKGKMFVDFWDSAHNTEICQMSVHDYYQSKSKFNQYSYEYGIRLARKELTALKALARPSDYDILACLEKNEPGTMHDFFNEFGFEVKNVDDMFRFMNTYNACVKQYRDLCRIFTTEQIEQLREIY